MSAGKFKAGANVFAKIDGKMAGPFYLVQIEGETATLQGEKSHTVPLSSLSETSAPAAKEVG